jgi:hypothetical protein
LGDARRCRKLSIKLDVCRFKPPAAVPAAVWRKPPSNRRIGCSNGDIIIATGILTIRCGHVYHPQLVPIWNNTVGLNHGRGSEMICIDVIHLLAYAGKQNAGNAQLA